MRYALGRFLQVLGVIILPFGIASELMAKVSLGQSLMIAAGGVGVFYLGVLIQPKRPRRLVPSAQHLGVSAQIGCSQGSRRV